MKKLISNGISNAKTKKNFLETHILYLAPHKQNSKNINICPNASESCIEACLYTAGRGAFNSIQNARKARTEMYINNRQEFCNKIASELILLDKKAKRIGGKIAVRLNGTSDLDFISILKNRTNLDLLNDLTNLVFYDYTKIIGKVLKYAGTPYKLTFSRTEKNEKECLTALENNTPVAVVFHHRIILPKKYFGKKVLDGDEADDLMLNSGAVILGLKAKGRAKKDTSGFVVTI